MTAAADRCFECISRSQLTDFIASFLYRFNKTIGCLCQKLLLDLWLQWHKTIKAFKPKKRTSIPLNLKPCTSCAFRSGFMQLPETAELCLPVFC